MQKAITMVDNEEGFLYPNIDMNKCSKCNKCVIVCPIYGFSQFENKVIEPHVFVAWSNNDAERYDSSSGGVFSVLSRRIIEKGGVVFGAGFDHNLKLSTIAVDDIENLNIIRGSKYLQSEIGDSYQSVKEKLDSGRLVLFSGTPCQIAGLYKYLGSREFGMLLTCEIICHGVPSYKLFKKYINEVAQEFKSEVKKINFRDKISGWLEFSVSMELENKEKIRSKYYEDNYMRLFLSNICLRRSCYICGYNKVPRLADITMGDYWNVFDVHPEIIKNDDGVSVVLVNTEKGVVFMTESAGYMNMIQSDLSFAIDGNINIVRPSQKNDKRSQFFDDMGELSVGELCSKYCGKRGVINKIFGKIYSIIIATVKRYGIVC